jgi:hypothetical protein
MVHLVGALLLSMVKKPSSQLSVSSAPSSLAKLYNCALLPGAAEPIPDCELNANTEQLAQCCSPTTCPSGCPSPSHNVSPALEGAGQPVQHLAHRLVKVQL